MPWSKGQEISARFHRGLRWVQNSKQSLKAIALPIHQTGVMGESRDRRPQTMEQLLNHLVEHTNTP